MRLLHLLIGPLVCLATVNATAASDVSLFDGRGKPAAYIAMDDGLTIYLWDGKPVAYLDSDSVGGYQVFGFNGHHLGWFIKGVIWDHTGHASCAIKELLTVTDFEPFKSFKEFKPFKSFKEFSPFRPNFTDSFGDTPCNFLLASGGG
jgi:hypothetical protein